MNTNMAQDIIKFINDNKGKIDLINRNNNLLNLFDIKKKDEYIAFYVSPKLRIRIDTDINIAKLLFDTRLSIYDIYNLFIDFYCGKDILTNINSDFEIYDISTIKRIIIYALNNQCTDTFGKLDIL